MVTKTEFVLRRHSWSAGWRCKLRWLGWAERALDWEANRRLWHREMSATGRTLHDLTGHRAVVEQRTLAMRTSNAVHGGLSLEDHSPSLKGHKPAHYGGRGGRVSRPKKAADIFGCDKNTVRNMAWVAGRVESARRRTDLSWSITSAGGRISNYQMKRIAIVERDGLWLQSHGHGDDSCFALLFAATWRALPPSARRAILKHWRGEWPGIALLNTWEGRGRAIGQCYFGGFAFRFHGSTVDTMPAVLVMALVAHELAHVEAYARLNCFELPDGHEDEADDLVRAWGFQGLESLDDWFARKATAKI